MVADLRHWRQHIGARSCSRGDVPGSPGGGPVWEPGRVLATVIAHQGGWDEILFVVVPIVIFAGLLAVANRRASRIEEQRHEGDDGPGEPR